ncbi:MAG TPA: pseudouridine synthase [Terracidiphilus sp.]
MPRKPKKSTEPDAPDTQASAEIQNHQTPAIPEGESDLPAKKTARKKRAKKSDAAEPGTGAAAQQAETADAELKAQAADTFDDAFEGNTPGEAAEPADAPEPPKKSKSKRVKKAALAAEAIVETPKPEPQPDGDPDDLGADEDDDLEGDWESGADEEDEEEENQQEEEPRHSAPRPPAQLERLQKILAAAGIASRRHAEELITEGRVQVNGKVVTELGSKADAGRDHIRVDGKLLHGAERPRYFVLNKPRGYVTTVSDPEGRPTVMEFFAKMNERLYPIGRLDYLSEGLLLMTNDGDLANKLTRAASGVEKTYLVKVSGQPDENLIDGLREGVSIDRGRPGEGRVRTAPARISQVREGDNPWFEVTLIEGRNRELRKMFEEIGHHVEKIRRVGYGPLVLDLEPGQSRELDPEELNLLRLAAEGKWKPKRPKSKTMLPKEAGRTVDHDATKRGGKSFRDKRRPGSGVRSGAGRATGRGSRPGSAPGAGPAARPSSGLGSRPASRPFARPESRPEARPTAERGSSQGFRERPRTGERPAYGRQEDRGGARPTFREGQGTGRGMEDRRQGGDQTRGQTGGTERRSGIRQGASGGSRGQDRPPYRDQGRGTGPRREGRPAVGGQDRGRGGFSRPQGQSSGANRPFRSRPEFGSERPPRPPARSSFEDRPARPGGLRIEEGEPRTGGRPEGRSEDRRQGRAPAGSGGVEGRGAGRPAARGQERGQDRGQDRRQGAFRSERPSGAGRQERGTGGRPPRPSAGGGFRPRPEGGEARGFTQPEDRRPPRPAGGTASRPPRSTGGAAGGGARSTSGGGFAARGRSEGTGGQRFRSNDRGRSGSGPRAGTGGRGSTGPRGGAGRGSGGRGGPGRNNRGGR